MSMGPGMTLPLTPGHEIVGIVEKIGAQVKSQYPIYLLSFFFLSF